MIKTHIQLLNVQLLVNRKLVRSLTQIFGISDFSAKCICRQFGLNQNSYLTSINTMVLNQIRRVIVDNFTVQSVLKKKIQTHISFWNEIRSVRGFRYKLNLPVHGQRTRTNHKTCRSV
jgi:small subunit ribosomal protein S13